MKDIPVFTADNGLATLILKEIYATGRAYVLVRAVWTDAAALLAECRQFCRACGAEEIYASWHGETLPAEHAFDLVNMQVSKADLPRDGRAVELVDLDRENSGAFVEIYNRCFHNHPCAAHYGNQDVQRLLDEACAWLARVDGTYAAVAEISREGLEGIAVLPEYRGLGYNLALAVFDRVPSTKIQLKVANNNERAMALYRRLGFRETGLQSRWYRI